MSERVTKEWAEAARDKLVAQVGHLGEDGAAFAELIDTFRVRRAWTVLTRKDGRPFRTIEEFCSCSKPQGLGTSWTVLRPHIASGMLRRGMSPTEIARALALEEVPEALPSKERNPTGINTPLTSQPEKIPLTSQPEKIPPGTAARLRAITRAPEQVQAAYREGRLDPVLAAKLGPAKPTPAQTARVEAVAAAIAPVRDREAVEIIVREKLELPKPTSVDRAMAIVRGMSTTELVAFEAAFTSHLRDKKEAAA